MKTTYRLKPMAAARILAELLSLIVCVLGPLVGYPLGLFNSLPTMFRLVPLVVFLVAALLLPFYGFITFAVVREDDALTAISLLRKSKCAWQDIKSIKRRTTWNQTRYVLTTAAGTEINFPIWLSNCDQLVKEIRDHVPSSGEAPSEGGIKMFRGSLSALVIQFFQSVLGLILAGIVWFFIFTTLFAKPVSQSDKLLVIGFALLVTGMFLWRALMVFLMPFVISSSPEELTLKSLFYRTAFPWDDIVSIALAPPLLPEGFILKTKRGDFLIAGSIEASDELKQELDGVIDSRPKKATA